MDDKSVATESESPGTDSSDFPLYRDTQRKLRETWAPNIEQSVKCRLLRSGSGKSSMIPAKSLARSALSAKFARYETRRSRSAGVLDAIPTASCFQRRNRDRCLPCMHKSLLRKADEGVPSRAFPLPEIESRDDSESSSDELSEFYEEVRKIYSEKKALPRYSERVREDKPTSRQEEQEEDVAISTKIDDPEQPKEKTFESTESLLSRDRRSVKATPSSISISSERSKISSSHSSDDETSSPLALDNDPSQYKNMAPCHLPTVLVPSMEPFRALRQRKSTIAKESRITLTESATKERSADEERHDDDDAKTAKTAKEKSQPVQKKLDEKSERSNEDEKENVEEKEDMFLNKTRVLEKIKSEQQMTSPIVESAPRGELKRERSCATVEDLSKDSTRGTFETPRSKTKDGREGVISEEEDSAKESASSGPTDAERRTELPLLTVAEISRFLGKEIREGASAATMLEILAREFSSRLIKQQSTAAGIRRAKLVAGLTSALADSKRYLSSDRFPSDLVFSTEQPPACNSRLLRRALPLDSYNLVAPLLGMPIWWPKKKRVKRPVEVEAEIEADEEMEDEIPFSLVVRTYNRNDLSID